MQSNKHNLNGVKRFFLVLVELFLFNLSFVMSFYLKFGKEVPAFNYSAYEATALYSTVFFLVISLLLGSYIFYNRTLGDIFFTTIIGQILTFLLIIVVSFMGRWFSFPRSVLFYSFVISSLLLFCWRGLVYYSYLKLSPVKKVAIFGTEEQVVKAMNNFNTAKNNKHKITAVVLDRYEENLAHLLPQQDIFYFADPEISSDLKKSLANQVMKAEKNIFFPTNFENLLLAKPHMMNFEDESIIEVSPFRMEVTQAAVKRFFDIVVSLIGLILLSPIILITALLVKLTSKGPVFYSQVRITLNQREFKILKFRTMSATAEKNSGPVLAKANDARVTTVGKYLRKLRIDEIPQFINVLKGDMSIVGPRPERPFFVDQFNEEESSYYLRHNVRAGITGYAQVYGKYASDFKAKLQFDLLYIKEYSLILDCKILLQTIKILFDKVSSQGLEEGDMPTTLKEVSAGVQIYH